MFSIGEFSTISGIPVRTLRFYHEKGCSCRRPSIRHTNYRSYDERNLEIAKVIVALRGLEFSLDEIREILAECRDDADILGSPGTTTECRSTGKVCSTTRTLSTRSTN